jgi:hypothetical protein
MGMLNFGYTDGFESREFAKCLAILGKRWLKLNEGEGV